MNTTGSERYVTYLRVSTAAQGRSGLGIEAQQRAILSHLNGRKLISEFVEVETGRKNDRPQLLQALATCRVHNCTLLVAKLDRLARNVAFVSALMEAGVEFEACDYPTANRLTIHILAAVAENECKMISERTRSALAAAKTRGVKLGGFRGRAGTPADLLKARTARTAKAKRYAVDLAPLIETIRCEGARSLRLIAAGLNQRGITASRGGSWSAAQVRSVLRRITTLDYDLSHQSLRIPAPTCAVVGP
jgi:DNA invertase Pin-like site-specific DNA recombinase